MKKHKDTIYALIIVCMTTFNISGFISLVLKVTRNLTLIEDALNSVRRNLIELCVNYDDIKHLRTPPFVNKEGWHNLGITPTIEQVVNKYHEIIRAGHEKGE